MERMYHLVGEFGLFGFTILYPSVILNDPGSSDLLGFNINHYNLLCFTHQSFLANPVRLIYYFLPINHF